MKYFQINGFFVTDYEDGNFAKYCIHKMKPERNVLKSFRAANRVFDELGDAVIYCIGLANGCGNDNKLMVMIEAFNAITKENPQTA